VTLFHDDLIDIHVFNIRATNFLREIAEEYKLDITRVISMGHSAGGHLALWLGGRHNIPQVFH
jgi:acetyl esterase/lipase